jgi:hypothetical protein
LNGPPGVKESSIHWEEKWDLRNVDFVYRKKIEESYPNWDFFIWRVDLNIEKSWLTWNDSILAKGVKGPHDGDFSSEILSNRIISDYKFSNRNFFGSIKDFFFINS